MENKKLVAIGEALIDFIPKEAGVSFSQVSAFAPKVGGAPANVCGAFCALGGQASIITQLGDDPFGKKIADELAGYGIDTSAISFTDKANTCLAFVSLEADGNRTFSFYRKPSADMLYEPSQVKAEYFENAYALHFCSVSLGDFPMKDAHYTAIDYAAAHGALISFDPNLRFPLWDDLSLLKARVREFIPKCNILKISDEELEFITGHEDIDEASPELLQAGVSLIVYTCGTDGAYAITSDHKCFVPSKKVKAVDTTGAGDGFIGSFLYKLQEAGIDAGNLSDVSEDILKNCLEYATAFCGESVQHEGAIASYPKTV